MTYGTRKKTRKIYWYQAKQKLKPPILTRNKEGHCIITKVLIHQEDITIISMFAGNIRAPKFMKQTVTG